MTTAAERWIDYTEERAHAVRQELDRAWEFIGEHLPERHRIQAWEFLRGVHCALHHIDNGLAEVRKDLPESKENA